MGKSDPFSIRLPQELYDEVFGVIGATGGEITRSDIICRALRAYLSLLRLNPGMIEGYQIKNDKSVTRGDTSSHNSPEIEDIF